MTEVVELRSVVVKGLGQTFGAGDGGWSLDGTTVQVSCSSYLVGRCQL